MEQTERYNPINNRIHGGVFLYGAGANGVWCKDYLCKEQIPVLGFIDSNPKMEGSEISGVKVVSYETYCKKHKDIPILVSSKHHSAEIMASHPENGIMMSFDAWFELGHEGEYNQLNFEDEKSVQVLHAVRMSMLESNESLLWPIAESNQYFCMAPFINTGTETYVDLGACTGDTIERFLVAQNGAFRHIYAFEPGKRQREALSKRMERLTSEWSLNSDSITVEAAATGKVPGEFPLQTQGNIMSSSIVSDGTKSGEMYEMVPVIQLDEYFAEKDISFIKYDIEGSEMDTLYGAEHLIKRCRPKMAISVYHRPDDLINIYRLLEEWGLNYKFSLRHHSSLLMETTLYCY